MEMKEIKTGAEFTDHGSDCGAIFEITCPECGDRIQLAESGWWDTTCSCGIKWGLVIYAEGYKEE
jgi:hypothetical protein